MTSPYQKILDSKDNIKHVANGWVTSDGAIHLYEYNHYDDVVKYEARLKEQEQETKED
jgi:ssRNA-specific RNase YbeY (16S rRNA maturation enzyme)